MKSITIVAVTALLLASCSSLNYLASDNYVKAHLEITTVRASVTDMHRLQQWTTQFGPGYTANDVGVMVANRLERQGLHDASVLVEIVSWCNPPYRMGMLSENTWRISVYQAQAR
jgi:hypothetical protein